MPMRRRSIPAIYLSIGSLSVSGLAGLLGCVGTPANRSADIAEERRVLLVENRVEKYPVEQLRVESPPSNQTQASQALVTQGLATQDPQVNLPPEQSMLDTPERVSQATRENPAAPRAEQLASYAQPISHPTVNKQTEANASQQESPSNVPSSAYYPAKPVATPHNRANDQAKVRESSSPPVNLVSARTSTAAAPNEQSVTRLAAVTERLSGPPVPSTPIVEVPLLQEAQEADEVDYSQQLAMEGVMQLNLPTVLSMVDNRHPIVGIARWRVQQAYAELLQAKALWLPTIQAGFGFHRHDGNYQASNGQIVDVNRNSFQYGLGNGATGAGTTPRPGLLAQFHLADAIFLPKVSRKSAWAQGHAANAQLNQQLLDAGIAYLNLLEAHQDLRVIEESQVRFSVLAQLTDDFAETGQGLKADADRLRTEVRLMHAEVLGAGERVAVASSLLVQSLSLDSYNDVLPMDANVVPIEMVAPGATKGDLVSTALSCRPELKESQALVAAACEAYRREKFAPFVPSVLLGFSTGGFGGGLGNTLADVEGRYDFDALMTWQVRNFGLGEKAARRRRSAQVQQAKFEKVRVMDQIAQDVTQAHAQSTFRREQIEATRDAIRHARDSYELNLERIRDGQGLPLEVLQSAEALETAQRAYLQAVIAFNQAQLQLQWAMGWPVSNVSTAELALEP